MTGFAILTSGATCRPGAGETPCPTGSQDRAFNPARDLENCVVGTREGEPPQSRHGTVFNVFCPGRMSKSQAVDVANALARGQPANPIPRAYRRVNLEPRYIRASTVRPGDTSGIHGWNHFTCGPGQRQVATHVKIEFGAEAPSSETIAGTCTEVNRSGSVRIGAQAEIQYRCNIHIMAHERRQNGRRPWVPQIARTLIQNDPGIGATARAAGAHVCILPSTDIQCAPCTSSDNLVVRVSTVRRGEQCPAGTSFILF